MNLLVDIGNTRLQWASERDGELSQQGAVFHRHAEKLLPLLSEWRSLENPEKVVVANVAGKRFSDELSILADSLWSITPLFPEVKKSAFGIEIAYEHPGQLGVDRWLAMIGTRRHVSSACCIVDCGTAITIDIVNAKGRHLGGFILPGPELMRSSLNHHAENILVEGDNFFYGDEMPTSTEAAVAGGLTLAIDGAVNSALARARRLLGPDISLILTGGCAGYLGRTLGKPHTVFPDLVLEGLAVTAGSNP